MLIYRIPETTALDPECIFIHKNHVGHRMCVIPHPQRGDGKALRNIAISLDCHVETLALHE